MHLHRIRPPAGVVLAIALALVVLLAVATSSADAPARAKTLAVDCRSPALGGMLPAAVYLPAGYTRRGPRRPVIYFLHGLPAGPTAYTENGWVAQALAREGADAIVVAPQGARGGRSDEEYLRWGASEDWPTAISRDLVRCIDSRFHTIASRAGRALIGVSAGGFGAFNVGLRHLGTFAAVESWSGYFAATDPDGEHELPLGAAARIPPAPALASTLRRWPAFIGFYVGRQDSRFLTDNIELDRALSRQHVAHVFASYPGGHSSALWISQAPYWLGLALRHMAGAVTVGHPALR